MYCKDFSAKMLALNPLNGYNFLTWEELVRDVLKMYELEHTIQRPLFPLARYRRHQWIHDDYAKQKVGYQMAYGILLDSMEPSIKSECTKLKWDAYEIMCYLQKEYGDKVRVQVSKSLRDFYSCLMLEHESLESYEWKVKYLLEHLK